MNKRIRYEKSLLWGVNFSFVFAVVVAVVPFQLAAWSNSSAAVSKRVDCFRSDFTRNEEQSNDSSEQILSIAEGQKGEKEKEEGWVHNTCSVIITFLQSHLSWSERAAKRSRRANSLCVAVKLLPVVAPVVVLLLITTQAVSRSLNGWLDVFIIYLLFLFFFSLSLCFVSPHRARP